MTPTLSTEPHPFALYLPDGFIDLPLGELTDDSFAALATAVADLFGIEPTDLGTVASAITLATMGGAVTEAGATYCAAGLFRSPDGTTPLLGLVHCYVLLSQHHTTRAAIDGLVELLERQGTLKQVHLDAGPAVVVETVEQDRVTMADHVFELQPRSITAWIPDPAGTCVVGVSMSSNNHEDWQHITDLALGVFNGFEWLATEGNR